MKYTDFTDTDFEDTLDGVGRAVYVLYQENEYVWFTEDAQTALEAAKIPLDSNFIAVPADGTHVTEWHGKYCDDYSLLRVPTTLPPDPFNVFFLCTDEDGCVKTTSVHELTVHKIPRLAVDKPSRDIYHPYVAEHFCTILSMTEREWEIHRDRLIRVIPEDLLTLWAERIISNREEKIS